MASVSWDHDRNEWAVTVKMAFTLQVLEKAGKVLTGVANISF